ncbi:hypothetical protein PROFUN_07028 [Planoprotostelium fungivorum]|uniref:Uncharacterized protein n=1 Tax=Planoprotostelium fungivorum TaxID=1890364 RepID=A0A2P6NMZ6_9EUKA|nr:hypothetical protein PROFUN_07028 [Planoprotostelium fungivorum]
MAMQMEKPGGTQDGNWSWRLSLSMVQMYYKRGNPVSVQSSAHSQ